VGAVAGVWTPQQPAKIAATDSLGRITVDAVPVPLNPQDLLATTLGDFRYAGGVMLTSRQTNLMHELSDMILTGGDRFAAVGNEGVLLEARLVFDAAGRLAGVTDATLSRLIGENGKPLTGSRADAEGLAQLPNGDRLVSFERHPRILLYPASGGPPRAVQSPRVRFRSNEGMEALTTNPDAGADAYLVGAEDTGDTWMCRLTAPCVRGPTIKKPKGFSLVAMQTMPGGATAYLLRAYDRARRTRIILEILRGTTVIARMDMAPPLTIDNFEGLTSSPRADGGRRFYLISDDNNNSSQRTLLVAFDWLPR
jgi:hypothetical protein